MGKHTLNTNIHDHILQRIYILMANLNSSFHECYIEIGMLIPDEICKRPDDCLNWIQQQNKYVLRYSKN